MEEALSEGEELSESLRRERDPVRLAVLSDGVFAIAMTLLSIDLLTVAKETDRSSDLSAYLLSEWPVFFSYLLGFITLLVCWINHRYLFMFVDRIDSGLVWVNGALLILVAAVPLPTALLSAHLRLRRLLPGVTDQPVVDKSHTWHLYSEIGTAVFVYGATFLLLAAAFLALWVYAHFRGHTDPDLWPQYVGTGLNYVLMAVWAALSLVVAAFSVPGALMMWGVMFAVSAFPNEWSKLFQKIANRRSHRSAVISK